MSGPGVTHHERGCQHQAVPLITGLLLSRLGVPVLSLITRCIYSGYALLDFLQMHSNRVCSQMSSILPPCWIIITIQFPFSQAELGIARWSFEGGIYLISGGFIIIFKSKRIPQNCQRECDLSINILSMRYFLNREVRITRASGVTAIFLS